MDITYLNIESLFEIYKLNILRLNINILNNKYSWYIYVTKFSKKLPWLRDISKEKLRVCFYGSILDTYRRDGWNWYGGKIELPENSSRLRYGEFNENAAGTIFFAS